MINVYNEDFRISKYNKFNFETFLNEYFNFNYYKSDMEDDKQKKLHHKQDVIIIRGNI